MRLRDLTEHLGLIALVVEHRAEWAGETRLKTVIAHHADVTAVRIVENVINASRILVFLVFVGWRGAELKGAWNAGGQAGEILTPPVIRDRNRARGSGGTVVNPK